jgi:hypothetical protein
MFGKFTVVAEGAHQLKFKRPLVGNDNVTLAFRTWIGCGASRRETTINVR